VKSTKIPLHRNPKLRSFALQASLLLLVAYALFSVYQTTVSNLEARGIKTSTSFFDEVAPFKVGYSPFLEFKLGETTYIEVFFYRRIKYAISCCFRYFSSNLLRLFYRRYENLTKLAGIEMRLILR